MRNSSHISKSSGFKVPKGYFESKSFDISEWKPSSNTSGFNVPENYFETFAVKISKEPKVCRLNNYKAMAIAASMVIIIATLLINQIGIQQEKEPMDFSNIDKKMLFEYIEDEMILDHDMYLTGMEKDIEISKDDISKEEVLDYLDDSNLEQLMDY